MRLALISLLALSLWTGAAAPRAAAQPDETQVVVDRMTAYVVRFLDDFANVVAEEQYSQQTVSPRRRRQLTSDLMLVKPQGANEWYQFRDVRQVDGKPVSGRDERLEALFLQPWRTAVAQAQRVTQEGARYNLADIGTINLPLVTVALLQPQYRERLRFSLGKRERSMGPEVWLVNFQEWVRPTIFRRAEANGDLPSRGRVWVEGTTGLVRKTELLLQVGNGRFQTRIETEFGFDARLGVAVPVMMRNWHPLGVDELEGQASYGSFRRFEVRTSEDLDPVPPPQ